VDAAPTLSAREVFRRFWPYARPYRRYIGLTLLFATVTPAIETTRVWMFKVVIDEVLIPRDFGPFWRVAFGYLVLTLLAGAVSASDRVLSTWVAGRFLLGLRTRLFAHLQGLSLDFFERRRLGDVMTRLTSDIGAIEALVLSGVDEAVTYALRIVFFTGALFWLSWQLAMVSLLVAPLFWYVARYVGRLTQGASRERLRRSGSSSAIAEESFSNAALVQAYNRQETEIERYRRQAEGSFAAQMVSARARALSSPVVDLIELVGALIIIALGVSVLSTGRLTLGGLLVFFTYVGQLYSPVRGLTRLGTTLYSATAAAERVVELFDERPSVHERSDARALVPARGAVEFDHVSFRYPAGARDALSDVSLRVEPGEILALVGASGSGKSTIAKLLLRFYDPAAGTIRIDGQDLRDLTLDSLREHVAVLLQEALVFDASVRENIAYGRPDATEEEIMCAAQAAGAHEFIMALPHGYDTPAGQKGRRLSGGERQRVAVARAMIRNAPVLLLDEPTTGLDAESGQRLIEPLRRLAAGRATIVIAHDLGLVRDATCILVLQDGLVVERGTHDELLARNAVYAGLYRTHQSGRPLAPRVGTPHALAAAVA
jgi:ABC-type multidrug transport system fused ATPase/permease subunit